MTEEKKENQVLIAAKRIIFGALFLGMAGIVFVLSESVILAVSLPLFVLGLMALIGMSLAD